MDKLSAFGSYVSAVQSGSLSGAARLKKVSQPAISQQISSLEAHYGTQLLRRGRTGVQMTRAGELLYKHALAILDELADLTDGLETLTETVAGRLVVTSNLGLSRHVMSDVIVDLARLHPDLTVVLHADDRILDLASEGIDLALRSGKVDGSDGVARKIAEMSVFHVATPVYLDLIGRPKSPSDMFGLDCIQYRATDDQFAIPMTRADVTIQARIKIGLTAQFPDLMMQALYGNLGYARLPEFLISEDVRKGRLEMILPEWTIPQTGLFVAFPARERRTLRKSAFLRVLLDHLGRKAGIKVLLSESQLSL